MLISRSLTLDDGWCDWHRQPRLITSVCWRVRGEPTGLGDRDDEVRVAACGAVGLLLVNFGLLSVLDWAFVRWLPSTMLRQGAFPAPCVFAIAALFICSFAICSRAAAGHWIALSHLLKDGCLVGVERKPE